MLPKVRIAQPVNRPFQLRYTDRETGKEVRISCGCRDIKEAKRQKAELEAKLLLGIPAKTRKQSIRGPGMPWSEFREAYRTQQLVTLRDDSIMHAESRLDIAERILKPRTLGDVASASKLAELQSLLLAGSESMRGKPRSAHTVKGYMGTVLAAVNWAHLQGWIDSMPRIRKIRPGKIKSMKGRPITLEEFERMLSAVPKALTPKASKANPTPEAPNAELVESWRYLLRGLWASALRLDELMHVSWDVPNTIRPDWSKGRLPILRIPGALQKNGTEEVIPLVPWFDDLLHETPPELRTGWAFEPMSLQSTVGRSACHKRPSADWVGKVVGRIGKASGVIVEAANEKTGLPVKYASAHDLRRSCGERMLNAGVPPMTIARIMRHASYETTRRHYAPGDVQREAGTLKAYLGTVPTPDTEFPLTENAATHDGYGI